LKKFEFSVRSGVDFPLHDGGEVLFLREELIQKTADMVLTKQHLEFSSYYWRAPIGSGKTVFLKLMGRELQNRDCDVYYLLADELTLYPSDYFIEFAKKAEDRDRTVVLLIDQVQNQTTCFQWNNLLKGSKPCNLLVLGVGLTRRSPQFDSKYPETGELFPMFLTETDLPEICHHFQSKSNNKLDPSVISQVCQSLLKYTAGYLFPFVTYANYFFDPMNKSHLDDVDHHLSSKDFRYSAARHRVRRRCFYGLDMDLANVAWSALLRTNGAGNIEELEELEVLGVYFKGLLISPMMTSEIFLNSCLSSNNNFIPIEILSGDILVPDVEQVICAGLRHMREGDFIETKFENGALENAVGFEWGYIVKKTLANVWFAPHVRAMDEKVDRRGYGPKPVIDFVFHSPH
jgi:hypothetical protein